MNLSWDDLQTIEALVRTGTVQAAARELSLRHTSVSRRLTAIEEALGEPLFLRGPRLRPTPLAERIAERLGPMRKEVDDIRATVEGLRRGRARRVVVTTSDVLAPLLFAGLRRVRTERTFEVIVTDREQELTPGVVDMALRPAHEPGGALRGRRLGTLRMGVFRGKGSGTRWVLPAESLRTRASMRWWRSLPADAEGALSCDSLLAMRDACAAGLGRAILPAFLAHDDARLTLEREVGGGTPVWLLSPSVHVSDEAHRGVRESIATALAALPGVWTQR